MVCKTVIPGSNPGGASNIEKPVVLQAFCFIGDDMEFFITESQRKQIGGSGYFEFQRGQKSKKYQPAYWREDSLLLYMDIADEIELYKYIPDFQYYAITIIDREKWEIIQQNAEEAGGKIHQVIMELTAWVEENFKEFDYFVIRGI